MNVRASSSFFSSKATMLRSLFHQNIQIHVKTVGLTNTAYKENPIFHVQYQKHQETKHVT